MKHIFKYLGAIVLAFIFSTAFADDKIVNLYAWSDYLPDDVAQQFEQETGIHINYTTYDSNETMYAKLKADPNAGYDVVVPSSYFIDRMAKQNMIQPIDKSRIPNFKNLDPELLNKEYDPHNQYSIPYLWGTTCIVVNDKYYSPQQINSWNDFWNKQFKDQLLLLDDTREIFSMALLSLGYSPNDTNPDHIKQAYYKLLQILPNVKLFNDEAVQSIYIDEDATVGMGWSGDVFLANQENPHVQFVYPKEGFVIWVDNMAIPTGAQHLDNAYKLINFILRPDIAEKISTEVGYASPNLAAIKLMPPDVQHSQIIYPSKEILSKGQVQTDVGSAAGLYEKYMELLKIGA